MLNVEVIIYKTLQCLIVSTTFSKHKSSDEICYVLLSVPDGLGNLQPFSCSAFINDTPKIFEL